MPDFSSDWSALVSTYGDGSSVDIYNFGADKVDALEKNISNADPAAPGMAQMIANLSGVLETCDALIYTPVAANYTKGTYDPDTADACDTMIYVSSMIKSKFVPVFVAFGDFLTAFMPEVIAGSRALIPALYCTGNPPDAATTCGGLAGTMNLLNAYGGAMMGFGMHLPQTSSMNLPGALGWGPSMMTAQSRLMDAMDIVGAAADLAEAKANGAHTAIEDIRNAMHYMCSDYENIITMMTSLNEYHAMFEAILAIATVDGAAKTSLTAQEVANIDASMADLQSTFSGMSTQVDVLDYAGWSLTGVDLSPLLAAQDTNIADLVAAIAAYSESNDNSAEIAILSLNLKKTYIPFFKQFGDFAPAQAPAPT